MFFITQVGAKNTPERRRADDVEKFILSPAAKDFGLRVVRADKEPTPGQITSQIVRSIIESKVVVADLTGSNSNVLYEVGIAHAFERPAILLVKNTNALPFDVHNERMIVVGDGDVLGAAEAEEAATKVRKSLTVVLSEGYEATNLVTDVASRRNLDALAPGNPLAAELRSIRDGVEHLRHWSLLHNEEHEFADQDEYDPYAPDTPPTKTAELMAVLEAGLARVKAAEARGDDTDQQQGDAVQHRVGAEEMSSAEDDDPA